MFSRLCQNVHVGEEAAAQKGKAWDVGVSLNLETKTNAKGCK